MAFSNDRDGVRAPRFALTNRSRIILRALIAGLSLALILGSGVAWATYKNFTNSIPVGAAVPPLTAGHKDVDGADQNILLIGDDSRAGASAAELKALKTGDDEGTINADTMIVLHVPADGSKATLVSFPRDSWVSIPGHGKGKINSAYPDAYNAAKSAHESETAAQSAGISLTIQTIEALTGLHIDHYMQVNLIGFYRISAAIGGVTVNLCNAVDDSIAYNEAHGQGRAGSGFVMSAGEHTLTPVQTLEFVRQRHGLPQGDLDRIKRQQYFLGLAFHKIETAGTLLNPFKLHTLLQAVGSSLLVDPKLNLLSLAHQMDSLTSGKITFATLPNNGAQVIYPDGVLTSIVEVNTAAIPGFVRTLEGKAADPELAEATAAPPASVTVDVLNGTDTVGLAGRNAVALKALHFRTNTVDSTNTTTATTVEYPQGMQSQAKAVAAAVKGAKLVLTTGIQRVTLVLGTNGVEVNGLRTTAATGSTSAPASATPSAPAKAATPAAACIN